MCLLIMLPHQGHKYPRFSYCHHLVFGGEESAVSERSEVRVRLKDYVPDGRVPVGRFPDGRVQMDVSQMDVSLMDVYQIDASYIVLRGLLKS